jgi:membrane protease YdiL (CAAX protease family)
VPLAEERLWRGLIQPRMVTRMGFVPGLLLTALLFSLKHAIIDASFGRMAVFLFSASIWLIMTCEQVLP